MEGDEGAGKGRAVLELATALTAQGLGDPFRSLAGNPGGSGSGVAGFGARGIGPNSDPGIVDLGRVFADCEEDLSRAVEGALEGRDYQNH